MRIGSNLPIAVNSGNCSQTPATAGSLYEQSSAPPEALPPSRMEDFEKLSSGIDNERLFRVDALSGTAQQALSAYQATESLASNNPRNQLIGIDVYA